MRVGIKFCGHCNPKMDMKELYDQLKKLMSDAEFYYYIANENVDVLLILNACQACCATLPNFKGHTIIVCPNEVDFWPVGSEKLVNTIIEKIKG